MVNHIYDAEHDRTLCREYTGRVAEDVSGEYYSCPECLAEQARTHHPDLAGSPVVEVVEATPEESAEIAAKYLDRAARELRAGDYSHADVWINWAQAWLPASTHSR